MLLFPSALLLPAADSPAPVALTANASCSCHPSFTPPAGKSLQTDCEEQEPVLPYRLKSDLESNTEGCSLFNLPESTSNIILRDSQKTRTVPTLRMLQLSASRNHHLQNT
ncbi:hypothetical protein NQZ68_001265 [Dissostichus eleginoides]|nr:hypothetical protein NQZ68_001265 [Dissostichus eleginoides]